MNALTDETQSLRRCIRDLIALTALPAVWADREPQAIVESLTDVLLSTLGLDLVYVRMAGTAEEPALEAARVTWQSDVADYAPTIGKALAPWLQTVDSDLPLSLPHPAGEGTVQLTVVPIGYEGAYGVVVAGAQRSNFPTEFDSLLLNVGANQVAVWFREVRLLITLRESEERFRRIFEESTLPMALVALDGRYLRVNHAYCSCLGYAPEEILAASVEDFIVPADQGLTREFNRQIQEGKRESYQIEQRYRCKDGTVVWLLGSATLFRDTAGQPLYFLLQAQDVTARKTVEEALQEAHQRLTFHIENSPLAVIELDHEFRVQHWSPHAEQLFGWKTAEVLGSDLFAFPMLHPEDAKMVRQVMENLRHGDTTHAVIHTRTLTKEGRVVHCEWYNSILKDAAGHTVSLLLLVHDVTSRVQIEETLAQHARDLVRAHTDLRQIAYVTAHDLQEPVRQVGIYSQKIAKRYQDSRDATTSQAVDFIVEAAQRMIAQLNALMHYLEIDESRLERIPIDCAIVLHRAWERLQKQAAAADATLTHDPLPTIEAQPAHLQVVFQELLDNALKFRASTPPHVHVWAEREEHAWRFAVRDHGIGIDPQYYGNLFGLFKRIEHNRYPGTGMGLAMCKKIVERHGGSIWLEPTPGGGVTVMFTISDKTKSSGIGQ